MSNLKVPAVWTDDCQGKKDYDGTLVCISTRYWPRGGGFHILDEKGFRPSEQVHPEIKPSAHSTIYLGSTNDDYYDDAVQLIERTFEGNTQPDVQRAVEEWAREQFGRIRHALLTEFGETP